MRNAAELTSTEKNTYQPPEKVESKEEMPVCNWAVLRHARCAPAEILYKCSTVPTDHKVAGTLGASGEIER